MIEEKRERLGGTAAAETDRLGERQRGRAGQVDRYIDRERDTERQKARRTEKASERYRLNCLNIFSYVI